MDRIENLRQIALGHKHSFNEFYYLFYKKYTENNASSEYERYADAFYYAFTHLTPNISGSQLIVGEIKDNLNGVAKEEWENAYKTIAQERCKLAGGGQDSHMSIDYELLLSCGVNGIVDKIDRYIKTCDDDKKEFYLGDLDCMMLTHAHTDHMDERTIRALADTEIVWVVPEFLVDDMIKFGVHRERITAVKAGDDVCAGPLCIHVLKGRHFRPGTRSGIDAVGYLISADNVPTLAFPGDVRDYSVKYGEELNADHCFAHIWLTDCALEPEKYIPKSREFAEFMLSQSRKSILLAHLNVNREDSKRWTVHHALVARDAILEKSPETVVRTLRYGEIFKL